MHNVTCDHYMPWKNFTRDHFPDPQEAGQVCQFEVENLHATQWQFKEGFTCGNSAKRIVMCEKAFEVFKKVRRTEVGRAPLIHFQKIFFKKGFYRSKLARELKFYT